MDITSNLLSFLRTHKQAELGSFGAFRKEKITGHFDKVEKTFTPPSFKLNFKAENSVEDDEFVIFVSSENKISVEESKEAIASFVSGIKTSLDQNREANINGLGTFQIDENSAISFKPDEGLELDSTYFGMPAINEEPPIESSTEKPKSLDNDTSKKTPPIVENVELDEVKTDLANTLAHLNIEKINSEPEKINIERDEKLNDAFSKPAVELDPDQHDNKIPETGLHAETPIVEPPLTEEETTQILGSQSVKEAKADVPDPIVVSTSPPLIDIYRSEETITEAPTFIKEQHEEHPQRFGADPMEHPTEKSIWPKVLVTFVILLVIGALVYFFQPNLFNRNSDPVPKVVAPTDSNKVTVTPVDTARNKQDSIIKADSVLKANMVQSAGKDSVNGQNIANNEPIITFDVIVASYKTEKAAQEYITMMKRNGYSAKIANMTGTRKKISIASFPSEQEAKKQLIILQRKLKGKGFYVQKIKTP